MLKTLGRNPRGDTIAGREFVQNITVAILPEAVAKLQHAVKRDKSLTVNWMAVAYVCSMAYF